jgi:carbon storage regulator|tara:strand:- start:4962 stop:5126 length:165 start_codon:yes stop_codon:yes gene_type:complete
MLVLSRKKDQKLLIGENVTITVLEIKGSQVRLGITAPNQVPVHREEIVSLEKTI